MSQDPKAVIRAYLRAKRTTLWLNWDLTTDALEDAVDWVYEFLGDLIEFEENYDGE